VSPRSIASRYRLYRGDGGTLCAEVNIVTAAIGMDTFTSVEVPEDVREAFLRHQV
jgi:acyl-CoA thioesterase FadM